MCPGVCTQQRCGTTTISQVRWTWWWSLRSRTRWLDTAASTAACSSSPCGYRREEASLNSAFQTKSFLFKKIIIHPDCTENCLWKFSKSSKHGVFSCTLSELPSPCVTGLLEGLLARSAGGSGAARLHLPSAAGEGERRLAEGVCRTPARRGSRSWNQIWTLPQGAEMGEGEVIFLFGIHWSSFRTVVVDSSTRPSYWTILKAFILRNGVYDHHILAPLLPRKLVSKLRNPAVVEVKWDGKIFKSLINIYIFFKRLKIHENSILDGFFNTVFQVTAVLTAFLTVVCFQLRPMGAFLGRMGFWLQYL